jgi:hypothetical protein
MCGDTECPSCGAAQGTLGVDVELHIGEDVYSIDSFEELFAKLAPVDPSIHCWVQMDRDGDRMSMEVNG